ncbi:thiosulfate dehydrogenase [quinone] large subunit [Tamaricihabitans halophyticus]|uniref:Thiosulfate dehydrogenase [quinone] large subunit n=1 Tax=Tamaricihabitans halophyticus TaxID=1262583 RepID=A0A4R2Q4L6_9PSEU|nr:DoxX family membrane protein [Tamaricihabitans halophyticus]TCP43409.1 thiosulfate dehydrogenase [quinone] large subunit [Tamaricihabitans halophyticus]
MAIDHRTALTRHGAGITTSAEKLLAVLRIATGLLFLWAFLDKAFGWGYATTSANAWVNGGSPAKAYLDQISAGPFTDTLQSWGGTWWADWLFMIGLLGIGVAVLLGIGLRISAVTGSVMLLLMWVAEWPLARTTPSGEPTHSTNPIIEYHVIYALALIVLAACYAGNTWGIGRWWAQLTGTRWLV